MEKISKILLVICLPILVGSCSNDDNNETNSTTKTKVKLVKYGLQLYHQLMVPCHGMLLVHPIFMLK